MKPASRILSNDRTSLHWVHRLTKRSASQNTIYRLNRLQQDVPSLTMSLSCQTLWIGRKLLRWFIQGKNWWDGRGGGVRVGNAAETSPFAIIRGSFTHPTRNQLDRNSPVMDILRTRGLERIANLVDRNETYKKITSCYCCFHHGSLHAVSYGI